MTADEKTPEDLVGRVIYAAKLFGPTSVIAGVLVWQGIRMTAALQEERIHALQYNRELTGKVVEGLTNSTHAIEHIGDESQATREAIKENTDITRENNRMLKLGANR